MCATCIILVYLCHSAGLLLSLLLLWGPLAAEDMSEDDEDEDEDEDESEEEEQMQLDKVRGGVLGDQVRPLFY